MKDGRLMELHTKMPNQKNVKYIAIFLPCYQQLEGELRG